MPAPTPTDDRYGSVRAHPGTPPRAEAGVPSKNRYRPAAPQPGGAGLPAQEAGCGDTVTWSRTAWSGSPRVPAPRPSATGLRRTILLADRSRQTAAGGSAGRDRPCPRQVDLVVIIDDVDTGTAQVIIIEGPVPFAIAADFGVGVGVPGRPLPLLLHAGRGGAAAGRAGSGDCVRGRVGAGLELLAFDVQVADVEDERGHAHEDTGAQQDGDDDRGRSALPAAAPPRRHHRASRRTHRRCPWSDVVLAINGAATGWIGWVASPPAIAAPVTGGRSAGDGRQ